MFLESLTVRLGVLFCLSAGLFLIWPLGTAGGFCIALLFTSQPHPRSSGRHIYFVMLVPLDPPVPEKWRIACIGSWP